MLECEELDRDHKRLVEMVNDITEDIERVRLRTVIVRFLIL